MRNVVDSANLANYVEVVKREFLKSEINMIKVLSHKQAAAEARMTPRNLHYLLRGGDGPFCYFVDEKPLYPIRELKAWIKKRTKKTKKKK